MSSGAANRGVSLIETIVVVAIVGLLAALLVPGLQKYMDKAGNARCVANLRSIGAGMNSYVGDNGVYPYHITGNTRWFDGSTATNSFFAGPYLEAKNQSQRSATEPTPSAKGGLFDCPAMKATDKLALGPEEWTTDYFDYAQNLTLCGRNPGWISMPSRTVVVAEGGHYSRVKARSTTGLTYTPATTLNPGGTAWDYADDSPLVFVHNGGGNFLFADGHVAWHTKAELTERWFDGKP